METVVRKSGSPGKNNLKRPIMKIAYYLPSLYAPGGLERIVTFKANYLAEHCEGYEVYILLFRQR